MIVPTEGVLLRAEGNLTQHQLRCEMKLSADFLVVGSFYALEQAGNLLFSAVELFRLKRYSDTLVLSVFCLEELGRAQIFLKNARSALKSKAVTLETLNRECNSHVRKLEQGHIPVTVSTMLLAEVPTPGSPEEKKLGEQLRKTRVFLKREAPKDAHNWRLRALYVEPTKDGKRWMRPSRVVTKEEAEKWLGAAEVAYTKVRTQLLLLKNHTQLRTTVVGLRGLPSLPEPSWDPWDYSKSPTDS